MNNIIPLEYMSLRDIAKLKDKRCTRMFLCSIGKGGDIKVTLYFDLYNTPECLFGCSYIYNERHHSLHTIIRKINNPAVCSQLSISQDMTRELIKLIKKDVKLKRQSYKNKLGVKTENVQIFMG